MLFAVIDDIGEHIMKKIDSIHRKHLYFKHIDYQWADYSHRLDNNLFHGSLEQCFSVLAEFRIVVVDRVQLQTERASSYYVCSETISHIFHIYLVSFLELFDDIRHHVVAAFVYC